jgi:hypothetical protein
MPDASTEYVITVRLDRAVSAKQLAGELAHHIAPLIATGCVGGDCVLDNGAEGDWALEERGPQ